MVLLALAAWTTDASIDGVLDCEALRFSVVSGLSGRAAEMPLPVAEEMLKGLTPSDQLSYRVGGDGPRDVVVIRDGREVGRFSFIFDGARWWNLEARWCPDVDIQSRQSIDVS